LYRIIQIQLIIKTAYLLEVFKPHLKIFVFKIVQVEIPLTKAGSTRYGGENKSFSGLKDVFQHQKKSLKL